MRWLGTSGSESPSDCLPISSPLLFKGLYDTCVGDILQVVTSLICSANMPAEFTALTLNIPVSLHEFPGGVYCVDACCSAEAQGRVLSVSSVCGARSLRNLQKPCSPQAFVLWVLRPLSGTCYVRVGESARSRTFRRFPVNTSVPHGLLQTETE